MGDRNWGTGGARPGAVTKDFIWSSKQFRILCEMGYVKEDVETALRNTNMQLDDALEMLNALNRGGMPGGRVGGGGGGGGLSSLSSGSLFFYSKLRMRLRLIAFHFQFS